MLDILAVEMLANIGKDSLEFVKKSVSAEDAVLDCDDIWATSMIYMLVAYQATRYFKQIKAGPGNDLYDRCIANLAGLANSATFCHHSITPDQMSDYFSRGVTPMEITDGSTAITEVKNEDVEMTLMDMEYALPENIKNREQYANGKLQPVGGKLDFSL